MSFAESGKIEFPTVDEHASPAELLNAKVKRIYANAHAYHINSLALNSDTETFISADDLRINWWKLDSNDTAFSKSRDSLLAFIDQNNNKH